MILYLFDIVHVWCDFNVNNVTYIVSNIHLYNSTGSEKGLMSPGNQSRSNLSQVDGLIYGQHRAISIVASMTDDAETDKTVVLPDDGRFVDILGKILALQWVFWGWDGWVLKHPKIAGFLAMRLQENAASKYRGWLHGMVVALFRPVSGNWRSGPPTAVWLSACQPSIICSRAMPICWDIEISRMNRHRSWIVICQRLVWLGQPSWKKPRYRWDCDIFWSTRRVDALGKPDATWQRAELGGYLDVGS